MWLSNLRATRNAADPGGTVHGPPGDNTIKTGRYINLARLEKYPTTPHGFPVGIVEEIRNIPYTVVLNSRVDEFRVSKKTYAKTPTAKREGKSKVYTDDHEGSLVPFSFRRMVNIDNPVADSDRINIIQSFGIQMRETCDFAMPLIKRRKKKIHNFV